MAVTPQERAKNEAYQLWNRAEHVDRLAAGARHALERGDYHDALETLNHAKESASCIGMHLADTIKAIEACIAEPAAQPGRGEGGT